MKKLYLILITGLLFCKIADAACNAEFSHTAPACTGETVFFTNLSTGDNPLIYNWDFDDGSPASSASDPSHVYAAPGFYDVELGIFDPATFCFDIVIHTVVIDLMPSASYVHDAPGGICLSDDVDFANTGSSGGGVTFLWDFGVDAIPASSTDEDPNNIEWGSPGTKTVTQYITSAFGICLDSAVGTVTVYSDAFADFTSSAPGCVGQEVNFYSADTTTASTTYTWDFGADATPATSTSQDPTGVVYSSPGAKIVFLTVSNPQCSNGDVEIITINPAPSASFTSTAPVCMEEGVDFTNTGTSGLGVTFVWDFGAGAFPSTSSAEDPSSVFYFSAGTKTVTLTITNQFGCSSTTSSSITINEMPQANFTSTAPQCTGLSVDFTNTGTTTGATYSWNFGSGATPGTSTSQDQSGVIYSTAGAKTVMLVTTIGSCVDTISQIITIHQTPTSSFTSTAPVCAGATVNFTNTGSSGGNWSYDWDFGQDALPAISSSENPMGVVYQNGGTKTVTLTISDQNCTQTSSSTITINSTPDADFTSTAPQCTGLTVDFTNTGTTTGVTYSWNFGSGATPGTSTSQDESGVIYATSGTKSVMLITTVGSCPDTSAQTITIHQTPTSSFTSTATVCAGAGVNFTNTGSSGGNWSYNWDFGKDAMPGISTSENPQGVVYEGGGSKTVTLTISDQNCTQTSSASISIDTLPQADAGLDTTICADRSVQIGSTSLSGHTYSWFPAGSLDNALIANPTASPVAAITNYVVTVINTTTGCQNTDSVVVTMLTPLIADAGIDVEICLNDSIQIGAGLLEGQSYSWSPTTGLSSSTTPNPIANPKVTTVYMLSVTGGGCDPVTDEVTVLVHPLPDANAGADDTITTGSSIQLIATGGVQYEWSPSYGLDNPGVYNPIANPDSTTTYTVTVTDIYGCVNTDAVIITVIDPSFWIPMAFTPNSNGKNDVLYVRGAGISNFEYKIFTRWGDIVFYTRNLAEGWEGTKQVTGEEMPTGAYVYSVKGVLSDGSPLNVSGLVNLIR